MKKKVFLLVMCVIMAVIAAGCGFGSVNKEEAPAKILKVATDADFPPFEYYLANSKIYTGFNIELMQALGQEMGYDKVVFTGNTFEDILDALAAGNYDIVVAGVAITPEREEKVDFSNAYFETGMRVIVTAKGSESMDAASMKGKVVAGEAGSYGLELAQKAGANVIIPTSDTEEGIRMVLDGKADCVIANEAIGYFYMTHGYGNKVRFAGPQLSSANLGIAVAKGNTELTEKLNLALSEVKRSGRYKEIYVSYFGNNS